MNFSASAITGHPSSIVGRVPPRATAARRRGETSRARWRRGRRRKEGRVALERRGESAPSGSPARSARVRARAPGALILFLLRSSPSRDVNDLQLDISRRPPPVLSCRVGLPRGRRVAETFRGSRWKSARPLFPSSPSRPFRSYFRFARSAVPRRAVTIRATKLRLAICVPTSTAWILWING